MTYETFEEAQELQEKINYYELVMDTIKNATRYEDNAITKNRKLAVHCDGYASNGVTLDEETSKLLCDVLYKKRAEIQEEFDKL